MKDIHRDILEIATDAAGQTSDAAVILPGRVAKRLMLTPSTATRPQFSNGVANPSPGAGVDIFAIRALARLPVQHAQTGIAAREYGS